MNFAAMIFGTAALILAFLLIYFEKGSWGWFIFIAFIAALSMDATK